MLISIEELKEKQGGLKKSTSFFFIFVFLDFFLISIAGIKVPAKKPKNPFWGFF